MALIKNVEIHFPQLDPKRPNKKFADETHPPAWTMQIRTKSKEQKLEWESKGISVKAQMDENDVLDYWRASLKKNVTNTDGEPNKPVNIVDGGLNTIDPNIIGNGSVANIRFITFEYADKKTKKTSLGCILMTMQITKLKKYTVKHDDDFEVTDMEIEEAGDDGEEFVEEVAPKTSRKTADNKSDDAF
jgi:hypothetical protein